ncbi:Swi5-domain-containing protein [Decorospora gaudefroyi]|uniref:Swi5-domain-containing protein n=1 Tax=Decorospora gaudefroyi TaxID=184978 RepID=A0A6A5KUF5_9PLEO|nr:Swi5-domain-containing protein [Decorospora gaudefroyi]
MAIETGITEIADSEDDPMTSSPIVFSDEAACEKHATAAAVPSQVRQDAHGTSQALTEHADDAALREAEGWDPGRDETSPDVDAPNTDQTDPQLDNANTTQQEGLMVEVQSPKHLPQDKASVRDMPDTQTDEANLDRALATQGGSTSGHLEQQDANHLVNEGLAEPQKPKAADDLPQDTALALPADRQGQQSVSEALPDRGNIIQACEENQAIQNELDQQAERYQQLTAADASNGPSSIIRRELKDSEIDSPVQNSPTNQPPDVVMSDHSPVVHLGDGPWAPDQSMGHEHASGHAFDLSKATLANVSESAVIRETAETPTMPSTPVDGEAGSAAVKVAKPGPPLCTDPEDIDMVVEAPRTGAEVEGPALNVPDASSSIVQSGSLAEESREQHAAVEEASRTKAGEEQSARASSTATERIAQHQHDPTTQASQASAPPTPPMTTQEITLAELKSQKGALLASLGALPAIQVLMEESASFDAGMDEGDGEPTETDIIAAANKIVKEHIKLLHEYNELKDVGQGLMGLLADQRGVRIVEVQEEFGIDAND